MEKFNYLFEISLINNTETKPSKDLEDWFQGKGIVKNQYCWTKNVANDSFLHECECSYMCFSNNSFSEVFLSLTSKTFFSDKHKFQEIQSLNQLINELFGVFKFSFCLANIENTSFFTSQIVDCRLPNELILDKSEFVGIPNEKLGLIDIKKNHEVLKGDFCTLLYNSKFPLIETQIF